MSPNETLIGAAWIVGILIVTAAAVGLSVALTVERAVIRGRGARARSPSRLAIFIRATAALFAFLLSPLPLLLVVSLALLKDVAGRLRTLSPRGWLRLLANLACVALAFAVPEWVQQQLFLPPCVAYAQRHGERLIGLDNPRRRPLFPFCAFASGRKIWVSEISHLNVKGIVMYSSMLAWPLLAIPFVPAIARRLRGGEAAGP